MLGDTCFQSTRRVALPLSCCPTIRNNTLPSLLFPPRFFGFIVVCAFTLLNLYVGVIFSQFSKIRMMSETGSAFLTSDQNEWAELTKMVFRCALLSKKEIEIIVL